MLFRSNIRFASGEDARKHAFAPGNELGKFLACTRLSSIIIGSCVFVHAGILKKTMNEIGVKGPNGLYDINRSVRMWLLGKISKDNVSQIVGSFKKSMFWTRVLGSIPAGVNNKDPNCEKYLKPALKLLKVG